MKRPTSFALAGNLSVVALFTLLGGCMPSEPDTDMRGGGGHSGSGGVSGAGTGGAGVSCTPGSSAGLANFAGVTEVLHFYCGGAGCHNETQAPKFFDDAGLYTMLTTYTVAKCGGRVLVKPCKPEESALYLVQKGQCEGVEKMPKGCIDTCTVPDDLEAVRQWIANGAPR
jgi:hypothetical protein